METCISSNNGVRRLRGWKYNIVDVKFRMIVKNEFAVKFTTFDLITFGNLIFYFIFVSIKI